jgi:hypothetical protein
VCRDNPDSFWTFTGRQPSNDRLASEIWDVPPIQARHLRVFWENVPGCYEGKATVMETVRGPSELGFSTLRSAVPHPSGTRARVLLTSVFGPYAQDE